MRIIEVFITFLWSLDIPRFKYFWKREERIYLVVNWWSMAVHWGYCVAFKYLWIILFSETYKSILMSSWLLLIAIPSYIYETYVLSRRAPPHFYMTFLWPISERSNLFKNVTLLQGAKSIIDKHSTEMCLKEIKVLYLNYILINNKNLRKY